MKFKTFTITFVFLSLILTLFEHKKRCFGTCLLEDPSRHPGTNVIGGNDCEPYIVGTSWLDTYNNAKAENFRTTLNKQSWMACKYMGRVMSADVYRRNWCGRNDGGPAIGSNLFYGSSIIEGNGCIYTADIGLVNGRESTRDEEGYSIYRLKDGKWELFVSYPVTEEPCYIGETSVQNLAYLDGYIYYILLRDAAPGEGGIGKDYSICRVSEQDGIVEGLAKSYMNFYIYRGEIYYKTLVEGIRSYFKMKPDGSDKEVIYYDKPESFTDFDYVVGGSCLYLKNENKILGINLETGKRKSFDTTVEYMDGMFYEDGKLYILDYKDKTVYKLDVKTGEETKIIEGDTRLKCIWIHAGYGYYVEEEKEAEEFRYSLKVLNLTTNEVLSCDFLTLEIQPYGIGIEIVKNHVIISFLVKSKNEDSIYEYRYFEKEISQIVGME